MSGMGLEHGGREIAGYSADRPEPPSRWCELLESVAIRFGQEGSSIDPHPRCLSGLGPLC